MSDPQATGGLAGVARVGGIEEDAARSGRRLPDAGRRAEIAPATGSATLIRAQRRMGAPADSGSGGTIMSGPSSRGADLENPNRIMIRSVRPFLAWGRLD